MWKKITFGLMTAFLVIYATSLFLPSMVLYSVADSRLVTSENDVAAELNKGAYCWRLGGERLRLSSGQVMTTDNGTKLSSLPPKEIACTSQDVRLGWHILVAGWLGPLIGIFAWYANLLAIVSVILMAAGWLPNISIAFALGAAVLSLDTFRFTGESSMGMTPGAFLDRFEIGFYAWELSLVLLLLSQIANAFSEKREPILAPEPAAQ